MQRAFLHVGTFVGFRPCTSILLSVLVVAICGIGMARFESENRSEKLWVPSDSQAQKDGVRRPASVASDSL